MNLYILRHGIAEEPGTPGHPCDCDRTLTPKGRRKILRIVEAMKAMELSFDLILSSPFVRARQTAEIVTTSFRAKKRLAFADELAVGGNPRKLLDQILRIKPAPENILLVGHEPCLSSLVSLLVAGNSSFSVTLKKGGFCKLEIEALKYGRCATCAWLLTPAQMELMG
jgi:phosphohistidine phosphatase